MITTDADTMIAALRPIELDELVERASLLHRVDRKYILPTADLPSLLGGLAGNIQVLDMGRHRQFTYRSTYFDTPDLDSYLTTAHRRRHRFKIRIRSYLDTDSRFVEVKTRGRRGTTVKQRAPYTGDDRELGPEARAYTDSVLTDAGIVHTGQLRFSLSLTTQYQRTTLFDPIAGSRVTIDTELTWTLPNGIQLRTPHCAIVETKSGRTASQIDRVLWSLKHRPCSVSKYCTGLAALRPDLPSHHWQPVLRRHFRTTTEEE